MLVHPDAEYAGLPEAGSSNHAIVIGASVAGLLAARALAERFERVTVIERDLLPTASESRKGVPQSRHLHVLLGRGLELLEQLFPGFEADMVAAGARVVPWREVLWLNAAGWAQRYPSSPIRLLGASRELLEWKLRTRVAGLDPVQLVDGCEVVGLLSSSDSNGIIGVRISPRGSSGRRSDRSEEVTAALVLDASGRGSRAPQWLRQLGYQPPQETRINAFLGYATRHVRIPTGVEHDWRVLILQPRPPNTRGGVIFPVEGDRWIVTLGGIGGDYPPTDEAGFLDFTRSLPSPLLYESIQHAEPLSPIYGYRHTDNQRRHFEKLDRLPERFAAVGDAACAFNPVYGQGMTAAAMAALALRRSLTPGHGRRHTKPAGADLTGFARRFQRQVAKVNAGAWLLATGEDLRYPTTDGPRPGPLAKLNYRYVDMVLRTANHNPHVQATFLNVLHLRHRPTALYRPGILLRTLTQARPSADGALRDMSA
jgi:2-polyprenyl-6-methoxyphenol hydroxylase-like FAD-dependent oxidoreductase